MRSPFTYYGGKARMVPTMLPMIPAHKTYVEAFAGGASLFFAKPSSAAEYLNDANGNIANFYRVLVTQFDALQLMLEGTIHDEHTHHRACEIYNDPKAHDDVTAAWATWVAINMSFGGEAGGSFRWGQNKQDNWTPAVAVRNRINAFRHYRSRLRQVTVFDRNALEIIDKLDSPDTFFYFDPPYVGARQGHYSGYTQEQFEMLINRCQKMAGKFLLSSYHNFYLTDMAEIEGWQQKEVEMRLGVTGGNFRKTEVLTWNYQLPEHPKEIDFFGQQLAETL